MKLDYVVVMHGLTMIGVGPKGEQEKVLEEALHQFGIDPMLDAMPDCIEVALSSEPPGEGYMTIYTGRDLPDGNAFAFTPF